MMTSQHRTASVLLFSLAMMGMVTVITQQLIKTVSVGIAFTRAMVAREQAEMVALGGIQVALAQIARSMEPSSEKNEGESQKKSETPKDALQFSFKNCILHLLPKLDRWQYFPLVEKYDGIDAELKVCISVEEGKMPINVLFDEPKREFTQPAKELLKGLGLKPRLSIGLLSTKLLEFLKKRSHKLQDPSELMPLSASLKTPYFFSPAEKEVKTQKQKAASSDLPRQISLQNIVTTWGTQTEINPLFLSDGMCALLHLRRPLWSDTEKRKDRYKQLAEQWDKIKTLKNDELWKQLTLLFDAKPKLSTDLMPLFSLVIEPCFYSVLSCATVGGVTQQVLAIIERTEEKKKEQTDKTAEKNRKKPAPLSMFKIRRLYWV